MAKIKKSELDALIKECIKEMKEDGQILTEKAYKSKETFTIHPKDGLQYDIPAMLIDIKEPLKFNFEDGIIDNQTQKIIFRSVKKCNDEINKIITQAEKDIKNLGKECAKEVNKIAKEKK